MLEAGLRGPQLVGRRQQTGVDEGRAIGHDLGEPVVDGGLIGRRLQVDDPSVVGVHREHPDFVDTGLLTAADQLRASEASLKHIIFFSDGFTEPGALLTLEEQAADLLAEGITVSVVATGEGAAEDLRPIAEAGGGRYYPGRNLQEIPELIVDEAVLASRDFVTEGEFLPVVTSNRAPVRGLTTSPALLGYVATSAKATATVDLRIGPDEDPLLASWRPGLGRVTAWTSDSGERWAAPWDGWAAGPDFWAGVVKDTFPVAGDGGGVQARIVEGRLELQVEGADDWPDDATARVSVAGPDGSSTVIDLERISGRAFAATVPVGEAGTYAVGATVSDGVDVVWSGVGLTTRSYPAEYAPRDVGRRPLADLAAASGGRVDPAPDRMFDPDGTRAGTRRFDLRRWLLLLAVVAWPLAVAVGRLTWRRGRLAAGTAQAAATVSELRSRLPRLERPDLGRGGDHAGGR
ncbi:MAG: glutamine amidotransferase, partial [Actinomycetota bacterium]